MPFDRRVACIRGFSVALSQNNNNMYRDRRRMGAAYAYPGQYNVSDSL